ncbi:MAG: ATP-dependent DNA ligase [Acidimicrobiales bacterium]
MDLPVLPPVKPMLAKAVDSFPEGDISYEPKWDGFRCIAFRHGDEVILGSRNERPLTRYFPEVVANLRARLPERCVLDGEIIVVVEDRLDFDALQQRIHPAESHQPAGRAHPGQLRGLRRAGLRRRRPARAALRRTPPSARARAGPPRRQRGGRRHHPGRRRRRAPLPRHPRPRPRPGLVRGVRGAGLDGLIAKPLAGRYEPDKRVQFKIKHRRTADCVVAGMRWHKDGQGVGSLLLGLYDEQGTLHHLGVAASFSVARRKELRALLEPLTVDALDAHPWAEWARAEAHEQGGRLPGAVSRWNATKDLSWVPLRLERVAEVAYQTVTNGRFRGVASFVRWREDREPASCGYDQLVEAAPLGVSAVLAGGAPR